MRKLLLIEPHPDDACLSMHFHVQQLIRDGHRLSIASLANLPEIKRTSQEYVQSVGAVCVPLPMMGDIPLPENKLNYREVTKHPTPFTFTWNTFLARHRDQIEVEIIPLIHQAIVSVEPDVVYSPIGIWHPMHVAARFAIETVWSGHKVYYTDYPYVSNKYGQAILRELQLRHRCISRILGTKEEVSAKQKVFTTCYPTESGLMRFSGPPMFVTPEELYVSTV